MTDYKKPTLLVDFDGVIHDYKGWNDGKLGEPIPGAEEWLWGMQRMYEVRVVSPRFSGGTGSSGKHPVKVVKEWMIERFGNELLMKVGFSMGTPPHHLYISARCLPFEGVFPTTQQVAGFRPPWRRSDVVEVDVPEDVYDAVDEGAGLFI